MTDEQELFDFDGWMGKAKAGLDRLSDRKEAIDRTIRELESEREDVTSQIAKLKTALGMETNGAGPRDRGIKATLEHIAPQIASMDFDAIVGLVRGFKPQVKESSIRSALARLVSDEILRVHGGRGEKVWTHVSIHGTPAAPVESEVEEDINGFRKGLADAIDANLDGVDAKTIANLATKHGLGDQALANTLSNLDKEGLIESADVDGASIIRYPAKPGSTEELKRTPVGGKMLFDGAEKPSHA